MADSSPVLATGPGLPLVGLSVLALVLVLAIGIWWLYGRWLRVTVPHTAGIGRAGEIPRLEFIGGARVGMNYTTPLARLKIWAGGISITAPGARTSMAWRDMTGASLIRPALVPLRYGVEFRARGFRPVVYWGSEDACTRVLEVCEQYGVEVDRQAVRRV